MDVETALNVRDKSRMKSVLRAAGVPCARHQLVDRPGEALAFAESVGFPLVAKPPAGAGAQATYRLDDAGALRGWLRGAAAARRARPGCSRSSSSARSTPSTASRSAAQTVWSSISDYLPPPLEVLRNPWIQWTVVLPREQNGPRVRRHPGGRPGGAAGARRAGRADPHGVVPPPRRLGRRLRGRGPAAGRADHLDARLRPRRRLLPGLGRAGPPRQVRPARAPVRRRHGLPARARAAAGSARCTASSSCSASWAHLVVEAKLPRAGPAGLVELRGRGLRDRPRTRTPQVVRDALQRIVTGIRVELVEAQ